MAFNKNNMTTGMKVIIVIFCVILVLMMMLPSLAAIMGNTGSSQQPATQPSQQSAQTPEDIDAQYQASIEMLESRLQSDPENVSLLTDLGHTHFDRGMAILQSLPVDQTSNEVSDESFKKAIEYYDRLLANNPSKAITVDRALAVWYSGDREGAINDLTAFTQETQDFAPAYANLGMFHETLGDLDAARTNYEKAIALGDNDGYGAKAFAESRLEGLNATQGTQE